MWWRILPYVVVRRTGFPIDWLEGLQFEQVTKYCQQIVEVEDEINNLRTDITQLIKNKVRMVQLKEIMDAPLSLLSKVRLSVRKHKSISFSLNNDYLLDVQQKIVEWNSHLEKKEKMEKMAREIMHVELEEKRKKLWALMENPRLREAIWMLNSNMDDALERHINQYSSKRNSNSKKLEKRLITYLQRLCTKNETNSFFGPIDYASINPNADSPLTYQWIGSPWRKRKTFLSQWAAEEIIQQMVRTASSYSFIKPRKHTIFSQVDEKRLHFPLDDRDVELTELGDKIFKYSDGTMSIHDLSQRLECPESRIIEEVKRLLKQKVLVLQPLIPGDEEDTLTYVIEWLLQQPKQFPQKTEWIEKINSFSQTLQYFENSEWPERKQYLLVLQSKFKQLVGKEAVRNAGEMYADRTIIFEEVWGPLSIEISQEYWKQIEANFQGLLHTICNHSIETYEHDQLQVAQRMKLWMNGNNELPYLQFLRKHGKTPLPEEEEKPSVFSQTLKEYVEETHSPITCNLHEILEENVRVINEETLSENMYFVSLDIMLAAKQKDSQKGMDIILGEAHPQFLTSVFPSAYFHPLKNEMMAEIHNWFAQQASFQNLSYIEYSRKTKIFPYRLPGKSIEILPRTPIVNQESVPIGELQVSLKGERPVLQDKSGHEWRFLPPLKVQKLDPVGSFSYPRLEIPAISKGDGKHTQRIILDNILYQRERWEIKAEDWAIPKQYVDDSFYMMLHFWKLKEKHGLPDWVFAKIKGEQKPVCIHFKNLFLLEMLYGFIKKGEAITFTEMSPSPDELWLKGEEGRFCSEFRVMCLLQKKERGG